MNNRLGVMAAFALLPSASLQAEQPRDIEQVMQPFLKKYCAECHSADVQKGDCRVDNLSPKAGTENTPQWLEIMERINSGEMPPEDAKVRPQAEESSKIVEWIAARMKEGEEARMAARGRVSFNRLTRDEYVNTVRDLIGVEYDVKDPGALLDDPEWHGFERIGSVLTLSPSNIEKYLTAAETILTEAYPETRTAFRWLEASDRGRTDQRATSRTAAGVAAARQGAVRDVAGRHLPLLVDRLAP